MKIISVFLVILVPIFCFSQVNETFLDGNFINNPIWTGTSSNFFVNSLFQLQSKAAVASTSYLFTPSEAIDDATWECSVKINYNPSSSNYASIYLVSDKNDLTSGCNGYYVQIGGTNDEVSLFVQEGTTKTKIIDGLDRRTDRNPVDLRVKVTRDADGNFALYSKLASETDYVLEGTIQNTAVKRSNYFGLLYVNTASTGLYYFFDDILVTGNKAVDKELPIWNQFNLEAPNKLKLVFSEPMNFSASTFTLDNGMGSPFSTIISADKTSIELVFANDFQKGKIYNLQTTGLADLAGNIPTTTQKSIGIIEKKEIGNLIFNEVMFENPETSLEYIEIYNKSDKLLDVSGMVFTTRKTDGTMNTGVIIPQQTPLLPPKGYLALCSNAETVRSFHACPAESNIISTSWTTLNNESSTLVLTSAAKDSIFDELTYDVKWHNSWVVSPKGMSLERTSPDLLTQDVYSWHSSTATGNGTPGYQNSVYADTELPIWNSIAIDQPNKLKLIFSERMSFSASKFMLDNGMGSPISTEISADKTSIILTFSNNFEKGKMYNLQTTGMTDLAGNQPELTKKSVGIVEKKEIGDLIFNEVLFENPETSLEYIEIYNKSDKLLDVSGMVFTTRKTDGTMNTGAIIPKNTSPLPQKSYLALCSNAETVRSFHACPAGSNIISTSWSALNNESSSLVLTSAAKDSIFDELKYDVKWHNSWVTSPKGIALERTSPDLLTQDAYSWHSSTAVGNNGTPGYQNSVYVDTELPVWNSLVIEQPNKLKLGFSERMNFSSSTFKLDNGIGNPVSIEISADKTSIILTCSNNFEKGKMYNLQTTGLTDLAGNISTTTQKSIGIIEKKEIGDLIFNEVMFENPETSLEYIEIYNKSDKLLDVSGMIFTTRKVDGTMNTGVIIPKNTSPLPPKGYLALCSNAETVRSFHACPPESNIISASWTILNNESSTLVLTNAAKDSIFDELKYDVKWHNSWVTSPKGIALERTSPDLLTQDAYSWHSSTATGNGTPGYQNSVYVDTELPIWNSIAIEQPNKLKLAFSERMNFSASTFTLDNEMGSPVSTIVSTDKTFIELTFATDFQKGKIYNLQTAGMTDLAGNQPELTKKSVGIVEKKEIGDLIFNEVMFENPETSLEYIEIYNKSDKLLDVSGMVFTTRKADGTMNTGVIIPMNTSPLPPKGYLALCSNAETVRSFHACPAGSNIISASWSVLNNETSTLVLTNSLKDSIFDELKYDFKWHNSWVVSPKGIALERTSSDLLTQDAYSWHSSTATGNGTPGYQNSVYVDTELPIWNSIAIEQPNKLKLAFSERMNFSASTFTLDNGMGNPVSIEISADKTSIILTFSNNFEKGKMYDLQTTGLTDLAGNIPTTTQKSIGIVEKKEIGDLIFNEVMFESPETSLEYIEIYNKSDKLLDVSGMVFTTRKTDGTMNTGVIIPKQTPLLPPKGYLALCSNAETVRSFHVCPAGSNIISTSWSALNNESSTLVLASSAKDSIFDELKYDVKWHNSWVTNPKGIALERTSPDLLTQDAYSWHSSTATGNGTPGYQNSVYVDTELPIWNSIAIEQPNKLKLTFSERMNFSASTFTLDNGMASPVSTIISADKTSIELTFANDFLKGKIYNLQTTGLADLAGNIPTTTQKSIGIVEKKEIGDLIFNEVMFENPETSLEYIEIYNKSDKLLDVSGMVFITRKTDGTMNTGVIIPMNTSPLPPKGYLALCSNAEMVRSFHACPAGSNIISTSWSALNNETSTLVLTNSLKDSIFDELKYDVKWHNSWVTSPKGIALERTSPDLLTQDAYSWHSSTATGNGTPGYQNSVYVDTDLPTWNSIAIEQPNKLKLVFSERINFSSSTFTLDNGMGSPVSTIVSTDRTSIELTFATDFQKGEIYTLQTSGLTDLAGNIPTTTQKSIGIVEKKEIGDLIFNEVMFENPETSLEYIEIYNKSDKLLDVSGLVFTTRKTDGTMNTGVIIPKQTPLLPPKGYLALCYNAETVRSFHACPAGSNIISTSWSALNNESSSLVLTGAAKDSIFDELKYDVKWHNSWVTSPKGIALERTSPDLLTQDAYSWHSSTATGNGTPGYQNSVYVDTDLPTWNSIAIEQPNKLKLAFSERMNFSASTFTLDNGMGSPVSTIVSTDKTSIELTFATDFQKGKIYTLQTTGMTDLAGNQPELTKKSVGIVEKKEIGDLIFNEVMFENPETSLEYIEIYNKSDKLLDVSGMIFTTRKTDGTLNTGVIIPKNTSPLPPKGYLGLCSNAEAVRSFHACPPESNIISASWITLNNESSTLVLTNAAKDSIFDELKYDVKWHNSWVVSPKGIALERTSPDLLTQDAYSWHSGSPNTNYGTPGYQNSLYVDTELPTWNSITIEQPNKLKLAFSERMDFSSSTFMLDNGMGSPVSIEISTDKTSIILVYAGNFEKGKVYTLQTNGLTDLAGNIPATTQKSIGIIEKKEIGDLIFNEVMFENPETSLEYIEIYNKSDKLLDVSGMIFTTRKTYGTMNPGVIIPKQTPLLPPKGYLAFCSNAETVRSFHACPAGSNIISTSWSALNNETSTLVLTNSLKDSIFDELKYDVKWHNSWVTSPKGIALERTSPHLLTQDVYSWHSASSNNNYGTPGYQNSVYVDAELPVWTSLVIEQPNKLKLTFSERMNFSASSFTLDNGMGSPVSTIISADKTSIELTFTTDFQKRTVYTLQTTGMIDLAGNQAEQSKKSVGIIEKKEIGDLIFNEVMFENPEASLEYIEIYNKSDKLLDVSGMVFTTRKTDGTMNTGVIIPKQTPLLPPKGYLALCSNAETVRSFHACPAGSNIITTSWSALNNESSTLVLMSAAKDSIFDELEYDVKWHNSWVVSPKGIALERSSSDLMTQDAYSWHSSTAVGNYGTPGYQNSVYVDTELPTWNSIAIEQPNKLKLAFSERMNFSASTFTLDNGIGSPISIIVSTDKTSIELTFATDFQKGKIYNLQTTGLTDLAGNQPEQTKKSVGIIEKKEIGDLIFNEVMFENPEASLEYIEIYNKSDKLLDVSGMIFTSRKADGTMNTGVIIPQQTHVQPHGYIAFCSNAELLRSYYSCPLESNIISTAWNSLSNESAVLVLTNSAKDTIFDELQYNVKWHNPLVKNPKGVSLERINPDLATQNAASWHSAASTSNFGTPGYQNSQFRDVLDVVNVDKFVWTEPESFSPDNDGIDDVCIIKYKTDATGYVANVVILNAVGARVVQLGANILLSAEGFLIWDGKTASGKTANVGIYVLYFEMFNPNTGQRKRQKLPIVVSSL